MITHSPAPAVREIQPTETDLAFPAMSVLRPGFDVESFVQRVDLVQRPQGYRLAGSLDDGGIVVGVAGFRVLDYLSWGRVLYIDDLTTLPPARGRGHASALLRWLLAEADRLGCDQVHLDSNVGPHRVEAHRLYVANGFAITSLHFAQDRR